MRRIGTDHGEAALTRAEQAFVEQVLGHGWALYSQAENLTRSLDFQSYWGPDRWARFSELKSRFDPHDRINAGEVRQAAGRPPLRATRVRKIAATIRRCVGLGDRAANPPHESQSVRERNERTRNLDLAVIGRGRVSGTVATLCGQNGLDLALHERGPRYHIGESLLPTTPSPALARHRRRAETRRHETRQHLLLG